MANLKRTSLYAPGTNPSFMATVPFFNEDCIVYDLEDAVAISEKDAARFMVYNTVRYHRPKDKYVLIRVNGLDSEFLDDDLECAVRARPDAIRLPKVEFPEQVKKVDERITEIEKDAGIEVGKTKLWCNCESYWGALNCQAICEASPRVEAMAIGAEDYTASMRATRTKEGKEIEYVRNMVLMGCRAAGVEALDVVYSDINDTEGLIRDTQYAKGLGFDGKTVVNPRQIDTVNSIFAPSAKEIKYAKRVMAAIEDGRRRGVGAVTLDGSMIDKPMERRAETTLAQAKAAGIKID